MRSLAETADVGAYVQDGWSDFRSAEPGSALFYDLSGVEPLLCRTQGRTALAWARRALGLGVEGGWDAEFREALSRARGRAPGEGPDVEDWPTREGLETALACFLGVPREHVVVPLKTRLPEADLPPPHDGAWHGLAWRGRVALGETGLARPLEDPRGLFRLAPAAGLCLPEAPDGGVLTAANLSTVLGYGLALWWLNGGPALAGLASLLADEGAEALLARQPGRFSLPGTGVDLSIDASIASTAACKLGLPPLAVPAFAVLQGVLGAQQTRLPGVSLRSYAVGLALLVDQLLGRRRGCGAE